MTINFKSAEEVKEYLKNMHVEYKFGCYSEKLPEVCHLLGDFKESVKKDFGEAIKIYKKNCDEYNYGRSCTKYGDYRLIGKSCKRNVRVALEYMTKGCELNDENGCVHGGVLNASFQSGLPLYDKDSMPILKDKKDSEKDNESSNTEKKVLTNANASPFMKMQNLDDYVTDESTKQITDRMHVGLDMLQKACDTWKSDKACFHLSSIYLAGIEGFVEKDLKKAYKLSLQSCDNGNPYACANLSRMHKLGDGVQQNPDLAKTFMERAEELLKQIRDPTSIKFQQGT